MNKLAEIIDEAIGSRPLGEAADEWGVPYWVLRDARYKGTCPRALHLIRIAKAIGRDVEELALAANGSNGNTRQTPPESASACPPARGRKAGTRTALPS